MLFIEQIHISVHLGNILVALFMASKAREPCYSGVQYQSPEEKDNIFNMIYFEVTVSDVCLSIFMFVPNNAFFSDFYYLLSWDFCFVLFCSLNAFLFNCT